MANMGAICYRAFKSGLYKEWTVTMTGDDEIRAELWRTEGRQSLLSSVNDLRVVSEEAQARAAATEGRIQQLETSMAAEIARRVTEIIDGHRKDIEIAKMGEITALKERIAAAEGRESLIPLLNKTVTLMESELKHHKLKMEEALAVTRESEKVKSSHAIGKQGEAEVLALLTGPVLDEFPYSEIKDVSHISHSADFHLWIMSRTGKRVKLLLDSKKYSTCVSSSHITKLYSDVDADVEAQGGILLSLSSSICKKKQFEISTTPRQKPVIYLTFVGLESSSEQVNLLCWAIRALVAAIGETDRSVQAQIIENIEHFMSGMNASLKSLDAVIKTHTQSLQALRRTRTTMFRHITEFREMKSVGVGEDSDEPGDAEILTDADVVITESEHTSTIPSRKGKPWDKDEISKLLSLIQMKVPIGEMLKDIGRTEKGIYFQIRTMAVNYHFNEKKHMSEIQEITGLTQIEIEEAIKNRETIIMNKKVKLVY